MWNCLLEHQVHDKGVAETLSRSVLVEITTEVVPYVYRGFHHLQNRWSFWK